MAGNRIDILDSSYQKTQLWLKDVQRALHGASRPQAYSCLRAVLHAVRDCLPLGEAVKFAAQMPLVVRGVYFDGWRAREKPLRMTRQEFFRRIRDSLRNQPDVDPALAVQAVLHALHGHLSPGEIRTIQLVLPREVRALWRETELSLTETTVPERARGIAAPRSRMARRERGRQGPALRAAPASVPAAEAPERAAVKPPPGAGA